MPVRRRYTERQLLIRQYKDKFALAWEELMILLQGHQVHPYLPIAYCEILSRLYTARHFKSWMRMSVSTALRDQVLPQYAPGKFRNIIRLAPKQFDALLVLIQNNYIFKSQDQVRPQPPVGIQLLVAHYSLGTENLSTHKLTLGRFTFVSTGYDGSMNDSLAYRATRLHMDPDELFQGKEYLLADAGYSITSTVIPLYKGTDIIPQEQRF
ncbi:hypothetical protein K457DRAFT_21736 [Linnemannia elongata AG-77]|uniref:DDE Tnp4 domain-containing protein n=1 Tax=Linnemannia elongata AG-77 TaxID=1314771 RepID=A0A197JNT8_9FUNG|nr:hypothetical protein K457DRAFT_21736 [Linnemannia elongata AG-77]